MSQDRSPDPDLLQGSPFRDSRAFQHQAPPARQELDSTLDEARQQIVALQRRKDELERAKGELEEVRRRHEEFARGRAEMVEALNRGLILLEHQQVETQRMLDLIEKTREKFKNHLSMVESLTDAGWTSDTLKTDLTKALTTIETARMEFNSACLRIDALQGKTPENLPPTPVQQLAGPAPSLEKVTFGRAFKLGFAFTLPLLFIALVILVAFIIKG
jgi:chromosome segregation ATPase